MEAWCDLSIIWARDLADNQVKGFIVENKSTPGFSVEKIEHKIALKVVQNGHITLKDCRVPEANRLQAGNSFRDTAKVLKMTRYAVAWMATGCAMGAYEAALKYCQERLQFGKPIASFQLVQDLLARMISNITASQCLIVRQAQLFDEGKLNDAHVSKRTSRPGSTSGLCPNANQVGFVSNAGIRAGDRERHAADRNRSRVGSG